MLRTRGSRGADKMDVLTPVRAEECQPVASNDFLDLLWRTAKDELALVLGCAGVGYTQHAGKPEQPCENLSFHFAPHSYLQLGAETCGQGFAETIVEQPRWRAVQQSHLLRQLQDKNRAGKTNCIFRNLDFRVAARGDRSFLQQISSMPAFPDAGCQMTLHRHSLQTPRLSRARSPSIRRTRNAS